MANKSAWPTDSEVAAQVAATILPGATSAHVLVAGRAEEAWQEFEHRTAWHPYLASDTASERMFDPPGQASHSATGSYRIVGGSRTLFLDGGLTEVTQIRIGVTNADAGQILTLGDDYCTEPANAPDNGWPIDSIIFAWPLRGPRRSVGITGKWGFSRSIELHIWNSVLYYACGLVAQSLKTQLSINPAEWKEDDVSERYSIENIAKLGDDWINQFEATCLKHHRRTL